MERAATGDRQGILIRPERYGDAPDPGEWRDVTRLPTIARQAGGAELERYAVFLVRAVDGTSAGALLPPR